MKWWVCKKMYVKSICNWSLPIGAFQDQCKQTMINIQINMTKLRIPTGGRPVGHLQAWQLAFWKVLKKTHSSIFPDISLNAIYLQHWRKSTLPLSFQENKGIVLYTFTRKTDVSSCKCSCEKIVTFASEYIIEFNSVYTKTQHVLLPTMIIDFSRFWYSKKPLNEKTLWKVNLNWNNKTWKTKNFITHYEICRVWDVLPFPTPESFGWQKVSYRKSFVTLWETSFQAHVWCETDTSYVIRIKQRKEWSHLRQ